MGSYSTQISTFSSEISQKKYFYRNLFPLRFGLKQNLLHYKYTNPNLLKVSKYTQIYVNLFNVAKLPQIRQLKTIFSPEFVKFVPQQIGNNQIWLNFTHIPKFAEIRRNLWNMPKLAKIN